MAVQRGARHTKRLSDRIDESLLVVLKGAGQRQPSRIGKGRYARNRANQSGQTPATQVGQKKRPAHAAILLSMHGHPGDRVDFITISPRAAQNAHMSA